MKRAAPVVVQGQAEANLPWGELTAISGGVKVIRVTGIITARYDPWFHDIYDYVALDLLTEVFKNALADDEIESFQEGTQQVVEVSAGGTRKINIRKIAIPLLYPDTLMEEGHLVGNKAQFLAKMDGQIGGRIISASIWVCFNGVLQNANFQKDKPQNSNIGFVQYLRTNHAAHVISEKLAGSGVITVGSVRKVPCNGAVVDNEDGTIGIPCISHGFPTGGKLYTVGTTNYKSAYTVPLFKNRQL